VRSPAAVLFVWALLLVVLGVLLLFWTTRPLVVGLLLGAAAVAVLLAALARWAREPGRRVVPDLSLATMIVALGLALAVSGSAFGTWLVLIGTGVTCVGLAGILRERM
jgi:chromate transport protein ChrA